jgi:hypothetical protein
LQTAAVTNILEQPILHIRFKFYSNYITLPIYVLWSALGVTNINEILEWIVGSETDPAKRRMFIQCIKPYLLFNMGVDTVTKSEEHLGRVLTDDSVSKVEDLIESGKKFIRQRLYPHLTYNGKPLLDLDEKDLEGIGNDGDDDDDDDPIKKRLKYKYNWLLSYKRGLLARHILSFVKVKLQYEKPKAIRSLNTLRGIVPGETLEYSNRQAIIRVKNELKAKTKKIDNLDYFMMDYNGPSNLISKDKDKKQLAEMKLANSMIDASATSTSSYNKFSLADILASSGGVSAYISKMIRKYPTPHALRNNKFDSAGPLYRMFYPYNEMQAIAPLGEVVSKSSQFAQKEEKEAKPEETGWFDQYDQQLNDGGVSDNTFITFDYF